MSTKGNELHVVKTRLYEAERAFLERVATEEDRSIAWVLRQIVLAAKEEAEATT